MKSSILALSSTLLLLVTGCQSSLDLDTDPAPITQSPKPPANPLTSGSALSPAPAPVADSTGKVTTASGLQYRVLKSGPANGISPTFFDSVVVHYRGTLTDGTVFDSSIDRGVPATFGVGQVIPGWTEALKLMKPGDQWVLYIPSRLAYGSRAVGDKIPPNSDLIFQVALLQVVNGR
ncbi:MAG: FKBP-type peptidyl-prolyl cis-trans isomerase [Verrucomicrobiaceae bacterium]|nr:FKBP-type peptidyl-prolyl cis-trans isomerase [Verrucomicrobiaceae bacterium]